MTYVYRDGPFTKTWGSSLTQEQQKSLINQGIHPEGIDIVYLDKDYNILSDKPDPYDPMDEFRNARPLPSHRMTEAEYEAEFGEPMSEDLKKFYEAYEGHFIGDTEDVERRKIVDAPHRGFVDAARAAEREAARTEFEKFQNSMRQLEEFATMSDVEIEKALEKQFRRQFLPEHPVEQFTPERLEEALGTLFKHGFEEGFRRVKRDNPELANQLEQYFGRGQENPPKIPQKRKKPVPPTPPEVTHSESNASN